MSELLKTVKEGFHYVFELKYALASKAQEAEDLGNVQTAQALRHLSAEADKIAKQLGEEAYPNAV